MIVYKITNIVNGKVYVGQTIQTLRKRIIEHKNDSKDAPYPLYRAMRKYGFDKFSFEGLCECQTQEELDSMEKFHIQAHLSANRKYGYNIQLGGRGQGKISDETRQKMSAAHLGQNTWSKGLTRTDEVKRLISEASKGNKHAAKLTWEIVRSIRKDRLEFSVKTSDLAKKYGCSKNNILLILANKAWIESDEPIHSEV